MPRQPFSLRLPDRTSVSLTALLLASTALVGFTSARAQELPTGGSVAAGGVTISNPSAAQLNIKQSTNSAIVNWQSFSIGAGATVNIDQPTSTATMLNRVTGGTKSTIAGQLNATGQVFLVNPNGIAISKTGKVSAAGFVGSSLDISDDDFKAGKLTFQGKGASAAVSSDGAISIGRGGYAALIGGSVDNAGTISVPLGKVGLGSGEKATLDLSGDGFLQVSVPTQAGGSNALVSNSGTISADGGTVELKAAAVRDAARQAVNMSGVIEARAVSGQSGAIVLGGDQGDVEISGKLDASASGSGTGGRITVIGRKLKLKAAKVDASGRDGGGTIKIGGDKQGSGTLQRAETTDIDAATTIKADATGDGDGGTVIVWSDTVTTFAGKISARGGDEGGNGGFTEVSGKQRLDFTGSADLRARFGYTGDLLLDPYNVTISNAADTSGFTAGANDSVINVTTLQNQLALGNVTISTGSGGSQAGDITIAAPISWSANTLTLSAYHSIVFNANATIGGVGGLSLVTNNGGSGGIISYALGAKLTFTGAPGAQALSINGQGYTLIYDINQLQAINSGLNGRYALANDIEASSTYSWNNLMGFTALGTDGNTNIQNGGNGFNGTFDGLGHIINQIWVRQVPANYVGLFGYVGGAGVVRNVGLVDAYISGSYDTGAIAGVNKGTISGVWASGYLQGVSGSGGLVGTNFGTITRSLSTVAVQSRDSNNVGGIAGYNSGTISQVYASGSVLGGDRTGGLVGYNQGTLSDGYSTGAVNGTTGAGYIGGSVGLAYGSVTNVYFDTTTSGTTTGVGGGTAGVTSTGLTTAQLQGGGATGLSAAFGGGTGGLYPYLNSFYPNGVQAISGIAYKDNGVTPLSSGTRQPYYVKNPGFVTGVSNGVDIGTVTTGVNGYYYLAVPTGWINDSVLAYTVRDADPNDSSGAKNGVTLRTGVAAGGNVANLNVYGDWRLDEADSSMTSLSALQNAAAATVGSTYVGTLSFANWQIETAASTFALDQAISIGTGTMALSSNGIVSQTSSVSAASLWLGGTGSFNLTNAGNQIGTIAGTAGSVTLADLGGLVIGSVGSARGVSTSGVTTTDQVNLQTTGDLTIAAGAKVSGTNPVLAAGGKFINSRGSDAVTATSGRWLVYAAAPTGNTFGNLGSGNTAVWNTAAGGTVSATGNRYVFAYQPTLTFTSNSASKVYGDSTMPTLTYTVSGYQAGVANAYLGDSASTAFTGAPSLSTPNTLATEQLGAGTYTITIGAGDIAALSGYGLAFNSAGLFTVAKRGVTVTVDPNQHKTYGDSDPASYTYSVSDLGNGVALVGALDRVAGENVGTYAIGRGTLTDAANSNYDITYVGADFTIGKRAITVTVDQGQGKIYGDGDPAAYTYTVSNLGGLTLTGNLDRVAGENAGAYAIGQGTLDVSNPNYEVSFIGADFTIAQRAITVTADTKSRVYGDANPALTYQVTSGNLVNSDSLTGELATAATTASGVGTYGITQGTLANGNYAITYAGADLSVTQRAITVTADAKSRIYGDANPALTYQVTSGNLVNDDSLTGALATSASTASGVGTYGITQGTLANGNYAITYAGADLSVTQRAITVTADAKSRIYGDANPALTYQLTSGNLVNDDSLTGALATAATTASGVGTYGITQGTLGNGNYAITYAGADLSVTQRAITVTADAKSRVYGDANPALTYQVTSGNLVNDDSLTGELVTAATTASGVGTYGITQGTLANGNYAITYAGGDLSVTQRAITVTADAKSRAYGDANPELTYQITAGNLIGNDILAGSLATSATTASGVGTYSITQGGLGNGNYAISYVGADLSVGKRAITVTADAKNRVYGDVNPELTYRVTAGDLVGSDVLTGSLATSATAASGVGAYGITLGTLANGNYAISYVGADLSVGKRAISVTADAKNRVYGDANPVLTYQITAGNLVGTDILTGALSTTATALSGVGTYGITQGTLDNGNYQISYTGADLTVGKRAITVTADAKSRVYGDDNPVLTYQVTAGNLVGSDTLSGSLATAATTASAVGTYGITQGGLDNGNYAISYVGADLTVGKRAITVTADAKSRVYGDANPELTYQVTSGNLVNSDSLTGALATMATDTSSVGTYGVTQGTLDNGNYAITYVGSNLSVTQRAITVTADAKSRVYGDANPTLTYQVTSGNLVNDDSLTGALATSATTASGVGSYGITQGTLANGNYAITYAGADLSVTQRAITVTADAKNRIYGDANPALTYQVTSGDLVNGDSFTGALATSATAASDVGSYGITQGTLGNGNYAITYAGADLAVGKRSITVTADAGQGKIYGNTDPSSYGYTTSSLGSGAALVGALDRAAGEDAGVYAIGQGTLTEAANVNYDITYVGADFTVGRRAITVVADAQSRAQGMPNPPLTYTIGGLGLVGTDTLTGALSTDATTASAPGSYAIEQGSLSASANYDLTYVGAALVVQPANVVTAADTASVVAYSAAAHGAGRPVPVFFTGQPTNGDGQTLLEDPRLDGPAYCQNLAETAAVCAASIQ